MHTRTWRLAAALLLVGAIGSTLPAQTITSSIVGTVVDPSNSTVAGADLALRQVSTGAERRMVTGAQGNFVFSNLVPGEYVLTVEAPGFKRIERKGLMLTTYETFSVGEIH